MEIDFVLASPLHRRGKTFFAKYSCRMDFFGITSSSQSKAFAKYSRQMDFFALFAKCFRHVDFFAKYFCRMDFLPFFAKYSRWMEFFEDCQRLLFILFTKSHTTLIHKNSERNIFNVKFVSFVPFLVGNYLTRLMETRLKFFTKKNTLNVIQVELKSRKHQRVYFYFTDKFCNKTAED